MGSGTESEMKSEMLMALGLVLVVMCNSISTESSITPLLGEDAYSTVDAASAKDLPAKMLQVPGIPKGHKVVKRIQDVSESGCRNACDGDKDCSGFQYVTAERLCKLLEPPPRIKVKKITLKKAKKLATQKAKKAVKKLKQKEKKKTSAGQIYRESSTKLRLRKAEYKKATKVSK